jgi:DNA-binding SARP family transcriptional activator/tRNA A-37 threonylcarbamoyl transferase component Bud32/streptogramin lyase
MEFRILGPLEVSTADGPLPLGGRKQRLVLARLVVRANEVVPTDVLIDEVWGDEPPESVRITLQGHVSQLRQALGADRLQARPAGYVLHVREGELDATSFEAMVKQARRSLDSDPGKAAASLANALALWRGPAFGDLADEPSLRGEIARLDELRLSATEHRISAALQMGRHSTVVSELEALTSRYPLRERLWAHLMLALYQGGRRADALSAYERARQMFASELGDDPLPELRRLHQRILNQDPELSSKEPSLPTVRPSRSDLAPGTEFAGYRIERVLGRGGMSVVYLAEHTGLQRRAALKVLAPQLAEDERFRERFVRESRLAASIDHPNVIPIYEAGESAGELFIAMRYVEGTDLRVLLTAGGSLEPSRAIAIVHQVAAALDAAHEQGLVHRDVKPANVLLARARGSETAQHVYLSDFGLTKRSASDSGITGTGQFVGTLDYAAPEQFRGGAQDARTDVYSLGCVLFEALTGHPPFRAENDAGLMYAHLFEDPPAPSEERPELPDRIDGVIAKAMAKAPEDRYASAGELAQETSRVLGIAPSPVLERRRGMRSIGVAVAVLAVAVASAAILMSRDEPPAEPPAALEIPRNSLVRIDPLTSEIVAVAPLVAPADGQMTAVPERQEVWVLSPTGQVISVVDADTNEAGPPIPGFGGATKALGYGIVYHAGSVWVIGNDNTVHEIGTGLGNPLAAIDVPNGPSLLAEGFGRVWVQFARRSRGLPPDGPCVIVAIDPERGRPVLEAPSSCGTKGIAVGEGAVWVSAPAFSVLANGHVSRIDPRTGEAIVRIPVGRGPADIAIGFDSVWVSNVWDGTVSRIDPSTGRVVASIEVGGRSESYLASGIAPAAGSMWVAVPTQREVVRIDPATNQVEERIPLPTLGVPFRLIAAFGSIWVTVA